MAFLQMEFKSEALGRSASIKVILPTDGLSGKWEPPFRTLYMLPGYSAAAGELITYLSFRSQSELKGIAVVIPDGENLFYLDYPDRKTFYSTYVGEELVHVTRKLLPLSERREDTFLGGISMGGYGALYNGIKYRNTFSKVMAFSPAADVYAFNGEGSGFTEKQLDQYFGSREEYYNSDRNIAAEWTGAKTEERPELFLCCGKEDVLVWPMVQKFEEALKKGRVPHVYREGHGNHELYYWEQMLDPGFSFLSGIEEGTRTRLLMPEEEPKR